MHVTIMQQENARKTLTVEVPPKGNDTNAEKFFANTCRLKCSNAITQLCTAHCTAHYDDDMMVTLCGWEAKMAVEGLLWGLRVVM